MKSFRIIPLCLALTALTACGSRTTAIDCTVEQAPDREIIIKLLNVNTYNVLDTVRTDKAGHLRYRVDVAKGQPEFIYLFFGDTRIAGLLLERGETAVVTADTLGHYEVSGSDGSEKLKEVDDRFARFTASMASLLEKGDNAGMNKLYIDYYRECVKFIMSNPASLTTIPVLYQNFGPTAPIFSQDTDAIHFRQAYDTLKVLYPESVYVKALGKETARREGILGVNTFLRTADDSGYPDLEMPDVRGNKVSISSLDAKVVLVHFWNAAEPDDKMLNLDYLLPLYNEYHPRGLEIYSVCLDVDKAEWASVVNGQKLPWINVNDGLGASSPAVWKYNVAGIPSTYLIGGGQLSQADISDVAGLRREVARLLR